MYNNDLGRSLPRICIAGRESARQGLPELLQGSLEKLLEGAFEEPQDLAVEELLDDGLVASLSMDEHALSSLNTISADKERMFAVAASLSWAFRAAGRRTGVGEGVMF